MRTNGHRNGADIGTGTSLTTFRMPRRLRDDAREWTRTHGTTLARLVTDGAELYMGTGRDGDLAPWPAATPMASTSVLLPIDLKSRVKAYATLHHMTLAQVLAEGAELLMERDEKKL